MILLLTGCINPDGMAYTTLSNQEERREQYILAIHYYLSETNYPIVFAENSNTDISNLFKSEITSGRIECLTFSGNQNKERGKGYGECEIIQYALDNSRLINSVKDQRVVKITGRIIVKNISAIIRCHQYLFSIRTVFCSINSDLSFPDSRIIMAPIAFYREFLKAKEEINDLKGYYFEHALRDTLKQGKTFPYSPFLFMPQIEGISGSTGEVYTEKPMSISFYIRYLKYAISLRKSFNRRYRQK